MVNLAVNVPGPVAAARLQALGATVCKVEPPGGDPLAAAAPAWYEELTAGQEVVRLDLKTPAGRAALDERLAHADLLLTAQRPSALARLGLGPAALARRFPHLVHVAIVGYPAPRQEEPGHDLTYLAETGLLDPPALPRTLLADLGGPSEPWRPPWRCCWPGNGSGTRTGNGAGSRSGSRPGPKATEPTAAPPPPRATSRSAWPRPPTPWPPPSGTA
nr:CoA transferase [Thermaerobacter marianensis]